MEIVYKKLMYSWSYPRLSTNPLFYEYNLQNVTGDTLFCNRPVTSQRIITALESPSSFLWDEAKPSHFMR